MPTESASQRRPSVKHASCHHDRAHTRAHHDRCDGLAAPRILRSDRCLIATCVSSDAYRRCLTTSDRAVSSLTSWIFCLGAACHQAATQHVLRLLVQVRVDQSDCCLRRSAGWSYMLDVGALRRNECVQSHASHDRNSSVPLACGVRATARTIPCRVLAGVHVSRAEAVFAVPY